MGQEYILQLVQKINSLMAEKKYQQAYFDCTKLLNQFPEDSHLLKLKKRIEEEVADENQRVIKKRLEEITPLWKEEKYPEIIKELKEVLKLSPNNKKIANLIAKAQEKYKDKIQALQEEFEKKQEEKLKELFKNNPEQLLEELFELEKNNPGNKSVQALTDKYRTMVIKKKIDQKEDLIYSDKYDAIYHFIQQLYKIDKNNLEIKKLEMQIRSRQHGSQLEEKNEYIYKGEKHLRTLLNLKKYDDALKAAEELLAVQKNNKVIQKLYQKAQAKVFKLNKNIVTDLIVENQPKLKEEYHNEKSKFIKL